MRTATVVIPEGYKDAKEFAADCGFLLVDVDATKLQQTLIDIDRRGGLGQESTIESAKHLAVRSCKRTGKAMEKETDEQRNARWDAQKPIIAIMLASSCFGHEVCKFPPCQCAQEIMDAVRDVPGQSMRAAESDAKETK